MAVTVFLAADGAPFEDSRLDVVDIVGWLWMVKNSCAVNEEKGERPGNLLHIRAEAIVVVVLLGDVKGGDGHDHTVAMRVAATAAVRGNSARRRTGMG